MVGFQWYVIFYAFEVRNRKFGSFLIGPRTCAHILTAAKCVLCSRSHGTISLDTCNPCAETKWMETWDTCSSQSAFRCTSVHGTSISHRAIAHSRNENIRSRGNYSGETRQLHSKSDIKRTPKVSHTCVKRQCRTVKYMIKIWETTVHKLNEELLYDVIWFNVSVIQLLI